MKYLYTIMLAGVVGILISACGQPEDRTADTPALDRVGQEYSDVVEETGEFLGTTRDEFIAATDDKLADLKQSWSEIESDASGASEELKSDMQRLMDQASEKLGELKDSGEDNWETASRELREDLNQIQARIKELSEGS